MKEDPPEIINAKAIMLAKWHNPLHYEDVCKILNLSSPRQVRWLVDAGKLNPIVEGNQRSSKKFYLQEIVKNKFDEEWMRDAIIVIKERTRKNNGYSIIAFFLISLDRSNLNIIFLVLNLH